MFPAGTLPIGANPAASKGPHQPQTTALHVPTKADVHVADVNA